MLFRRMAVIGIGQIGASFALACKNAGEVETVVGVARSEETHRIAIRVGAADECTTSAAEGVRNADIVYLAVPVRTMRQVMTDIRPHLAPGTLVTDAGSTKTHICEWAAELLGPDVAFIGGHPMAGTERHGPQSADPTLFRERTYLLCTAASPASLVDAFSELLVAIGAVPIEVEPHRHDEILAYSSHLAHIAAGAFTLALERSGIEDIQPFSAGGLRDTSRIAAADVEMWRHIFRDNADNVLPAARQLRKAVDEFISAIESEDWEQLERLLTSARDYRRSLFPFQ